MRKTTLALTIGAFLAACAVAPAAQASDLWDIYQLAVKNDPTFQQAQANYEATDRGQGHRPGRISADDHLSIGSPPSAALQRSSAR